MADTMIDEDPPEWLEPEDCTDEELGVGVPLPAEIVEAWRHWGRLRRQRWRYLPDDPLPASPPVEAGTVATIVRAVRWRTGHSQRALGGAAGLAPTVVARLEAGGTDPRLSSLVAILDAAGLHLAVVDDEGTQLAVPFDQDGRGDAGDRHLPAHRPQRPGHHRRPTGVGPHPFTPVDRLPEAVTAAPGHPTARSTPQPGAAHGPDTAPPHRADLVRR